MIDFQVPTKLRAHVSMGEESGDYAAEVQDRFLDTLVVRVHAELEGIDPGKEVQLRFGHQKHFWSVSALVESHHAVWWFLTHPEPSRWKRLQRRQFVRIAYEEMIIGLPQRLDSSKPAEPIYLQAVDLSASGCAVTTIGEIDARRVTLVLQLPGLKVTPVLAQIAWSRPIGEGRFAYGLDFLHETPAFQEEIARVVAQLIQQNLQKGVDITR